MSALFFDPPDYDEIAAERAEIEAEQRAEVEAEDADSEAYAEECADWYDYDPYDDSGEYRWPGCPDGVMQA